MKKSNDLKIFSKKIIFLALFCFSTVSLQATHIAVLGCGYVGLTLAAVLGSLGHGVTCFDVDSHKIHCLHHYRLPFYEPDLENLLFDGFAQKWIHFVDTVEKLADAEIFYICVGTPTNAQGACDCTYLYAAIDALVRSVCVGSTSDRKIICVKSTLPPGTMQKLENYLQQQGINTVDLVYNPEFMREGSALHDMCTNNPLIIGGKSSQAIDAIEELYRNFIHPTIKIIKTNFETAEMIKYAWNSFSAIRIAYVNELALVSRKVGADIATTVQGFALSEQLLPTAVVSPGPGYGGSCLPKDTNSFANLLEHYGFPCTMVHQAIDSNIGHKQQLVDDILSVIDVEKKPTVALLGLAFKANTDDIRYAPAITVIEQLLAHGVNIQAYDPKATLNMQKLFPQVQYYDSPYEAARNADCVVVLTEWQDIKNISLEQLAHVCRAKRMIDARNMYNPLELQKHGFSYINMGRMY